jgi:hypothetical protein
VKDVEHFSVDLFAHLTLKTVSTRRQWLIPVILATQEAEIRRIMVLSQTEQIVLKTQIPNTKKGCKSGSSGRMPA